MTTTTKTKRKSKCLVCMEMARKESLMRPLTKAFLYKLIREDCTHSEDERKKGIEE